MRVMWRLCTTIPVFFVLLAWSQPYHPLGFSIPVCHCIPWYSMYAYDFSRVPQIGWWGSLELLQFGPGSSMPPVWTAHVTKSSSTQHVIYISSFTHSGCYEVTLISKVYQDLPWDRCSAAPTTLTYCICLLSWNVQLNVTNWQKKIPFHLQR